MVWLSLQDPAVQSYIAYTAILTVKLLILSILTGFTRIVRGSFISPEDAVLWGRVKHDDRIVERIRRAHRNDLENIPVFSVLAAVYLTTSPATGLTILLFRVFTISRIIHSIVYILGVPQPARGLSWLVGWLINLAMAANVLIYYWA